MKSYSIYSVAYKEALEMAKSLKRDVGILKAREFNTSVFQVFYLPNPENRSGFELRCEVVSPGSPSPSPMYKE